LNAELVFAVDEVIPEDRRKVDAVEYVQSVEPELGADSSDDVDALDEADVELLEERPWTTIDWRPHLPSPRIVSMQSTLSAGARYLPLGGPRLLWSDVVDFGER